MRVHASKLSARRATLNSTSGGATDTELKELTVMPSRSPVPLTPVITATPVGNAPSAFRKRRSSKIMQNRPSLMISWSKRLLRGIPLTLQVGAAACLPALSCRDETPPRLLRQTEDFGIVGLHVVTLECVE